MFCVMKFIIVENSFNAHWAPHTALTSDSCFEMFSSYRFDAHLMDCVIRLLRSPWMATLQLGVMDQAANL